MKPHQKEHTSEGRRRAHGAKMQNGSGLDEHSNDCANRARSSRWAAPYLAVVDALVGRRGGLHADKDTAQRPMKRATQLTGATQPAVVAIRWLCALAVSGPSPSLPVVVVVSPLPVPTSISLYVSWLSRSNRSRKAHITSPWQTTMAPRLAH